MVNIKLEASPREILGKEVKQLRLQGFIPANLYGRNIPSVPLQIEKTNVQKVLTQSGSSHLIDLVIKGEKKPRNVLIRELQKGLNGKLLHMDLYQVSMTDPITVPIPIELVGESPLVKKNNLVLEQMVWELEVKCLPDKIPQNIGVDISSLIEAGHTAFVKDIKIQQDFTILNNPEEALVRIRAQAVMEAEVKPEAVEEAAEEAAPAAGVKEE